MFKSTKYIYIYTFIYRLDKINIYIHIYIYSNIYNEAIYIYTIIHAHFSGSNSGPFVKTPSTRVTRKTFPLDPPDIRGGIKETGETKNLRLEGKNLYHQKNQVPKIEVLTYISCM